METFILCLTNDDKIITKTSKKSQKEILDTLDKSSNLQMYVLIQNTSEEDNIIFKDNKINPSFFGLSGIEYWLDQKNISNRSNRQEIIKILRQKDNEFRSNKNESKSDKLKDSIISFVLKNSYFTVDNTLEPLVIQLSTRENGNVGDEQYSELDIKAATLLKNQLKNNFGVSSRIETFDEWVFLTINLEENGTKKIKFSI